MKKRFQFRHVNELTGLFVLLIFVGVATALFVAARSQQWFAAKITYQLSLPPSGASGLKPGNDVVVLGLPAGIVKNVEVKADGRLEAQVTLRRDFAQFIRPDTVATLKKIYSVAGDSFVELSRGIKGAPLKEGETIPCQSTDEFPSLLDRVLEEVRSEVLPITHKASAFLEEWARLGTNLNSRQADLQQSLERLNRIAANLEAGHGSAGRLLTDTHLIDRGEQVLSQSQATLTELQIVLKQLKDGTAKLPEVAENLRQGTANLPAISRAVAAEARDLPGMVLQVQQAASELQRLTEAMQRHWLLRKYVEPRNERGRIPPEQISGGTP